MIEIKNLTKSFAVKNGEFTALKNINLQINDGEIYGIIGLSGAGKSTLVRCINLLERPSEGSVIVNGVALETLNAKALREARRDITMIFQQFNLLMQRTCLKNVCFPLELAGMKKQEAEAKAMELLNLVGLPDKAHSYPVQLSGGQKQRVAIARALATNPKVLLCDEATSALDPSTTHAILDLIKEINRKLGITVIVITHQMSVVEEVCAKVAILDGGVVVEEGNVTQIFTKPQSKAAKLLINPQSEALGEKSSIFNTDENIVRVVFDGTCTQEALVSHLAIDTGICVSVLSADTRDMNGQCFGSMLLSLPKEKAKADEAIAYINAKQGITVEEVQKT